MTYEAHPLADIFPITSEEDFNAIISSIKKNGLHEAITLLDGKILDGRTRYRACLEAGIQPHFDKFNGNDPLEFVMIKNYARRHLTEQQKHKLTPGQLAAMANTITNMRRGGDKRSKEYQSANRRNENTSQKDAAKETGASVRNMQRMKTIKDRDPALHDLVATGKVSVNKAYEILQTRAMQRVLDAQAQQVAQEKAEQRAAEEIAKKVEAEAAADNERKNTKKAEPAQESDMNMTIEIAERYLAKVALGEEPPTSGAFIRKDIDTYKDILVKYGKKVDDKTEYNGATAEGVVNYIRGFLSAKRYTVEDLRSLMTKEIYDNFRRENNAKIRFAEEYHPTWGLPKIPLRQAEYNKLLHCLHPDRVARINDPELSQMFRDGLDIVRKLKLTISKPDDMRSLPKTDNIPDVFADYIAKESAKRSERAKKAAETRKQRKEAPAASPSL